MSATQSTSARDVVLGLALLAAFPAAVSLTGALSTDGIPDRAVPIVHR
jgi:hypothetical protein